MRPTAFPFSIKQQVLLRLAHRFATHRQTECRECGILKSNNKKIVVVLLLRQSITSARVYFALIFSTKEAKKSAGRAKKETIK